MNSRNARRIAARTLLAATGVAAAVSLAACSGQGTLHVTGTDAGSGSSSGVGSSGATTSVAPAPTYSSGSAGSAAGSSNPVGSAPTPATSGATVAAGSVTPECKANTLALSFGGGDAGMSQEETVLRFTNIGKSSCVITGFPGVSYVAGDDGHQVGAAAVRTGVEGGPIVLRPGQVSSTVIHSVQAGVIGDCTVTPVRGYRVYAPDDYASMYIPLPAGAEGCANTTSTPQLSVYTIKAGLGDPDRP